MIIFYQSTIDYPINLFYVKIQYSVVENLRIKDYINYPILHLNYKK